MGVLLAFHCGYNKLKATIASTHNSLARRMIAGEGKKRKREIEKNIQLQIKSQASSVEDQLSKMDIKVSFYVRNILYEKMSQSNGVIGTIN